MQHPRLMVHDRRHPGVGGQQKWAGKFQRTPTGNLQVLVHRQAAAKPRQIAEIDQHGGGLSRITELLRQLLSKQIFVTDIGRNPLPLPKKGRLTEATTVEITQRNVHELGKPFEPGRNELAEGDQMVLVVAPRPIRAWAQADH